MRGRTGLKIVACLGTAGLVVASLGLTSGSLAQGGWTCTAPGLVSFQYTGGATAYIHLSAFPTGGTYAVTLNAAKTQASGTTANGTRFVCRKG
jgi:hypothetical protein